MLRRLLTIISFVPLLCSVGCLSTGNLNLSKHSISSREIQDVVYSHHARIQSIKGEGRISVESQEITQSGSFYLMLLKPDSLLINLQGPFGINVGSVLVTRSEFQFYSSLENKLITGLSSIENLTRILHVQLSFDDLLTLFEGGVFLKDDLRSPDETLIENEQYVLIYTSNNSSRRYWVDPTSLSILKIQHFDRNGTVTVEQTFGNFEEINGITLPYTIRIIQPQARQMLSLLYSDILLNTECPQFTITIPNNAERIRW